MSWLGAAIMVPPIPIEETGIEVTFAMFVCR